MKFATMLVVALASFAIGAVACAVTGFLGFIGGIALLEKSEEDKPVNYDPGTPGHIDYKRMGPRPAA